MKWTEITVHTTTFGSELVSDIFFGMGASGVVVSDRNDIIETLKDKRMWDYVDDDLLSSCGEITLVKAFVTGDILQATLKKLNTNLAKLKTREEPDFPIGSLEVITREINDEDWLNIWKKHYKPIHIRQAVICPVWIDYQRSADETVIKIDPGMAFGTGEHETTSMCIDLMQDFDLNKKTVIDVGCGSGILGAAAILLGASHATMVDFDSQAVSAAKKNAALNAVTERCDVLEGDLLSNVREPVDVVFANITADVLLRLKSDILAFVKEGGAVMISGLINKRADEVISAYEAVGLKLVRKINCGEWNAAAFVRS